MALRRQVPEASPRLPDLQPARQPAPRTFEHARRRVHPQAQTPPAQEPEEVTVDLLRRLLRLPPRQITLWATAPPADGDTALVILSEGRSTVPRPGESLLEATERLGGQGTNRTGTEGWPHEG